MRLYTHTHTHTHTHTGSLAEKTKSNKIKIVLIIFIIILALVLCFNVGVYAAYALAATEVSYTKKDGTTVSVKSALDELYATQPLAKAVSVGDYVAYNAGNNHSYTSPVGTGSSHGNGNSSQTFTSSSSLNWRVLGWDEETGGVMLISEEPIEGVTIKGAIGYLYAEQELNEICKIYGYGTGANTNKKFVYVTGDIIEGTTAGTITGSGARSINMEDINKICGVTPSTALESDYGKGTYINSYYPTIKKSNGISISTTNRINVYTAYSYTASNYVANTAEIYKLLFRNIKNTNDIAYWLASRCVSFGSNYTNFITRCVNNGYAEYGIVSGLTVFNSNGNSYYESAYSSGIRPIVFLKSTLKTNGKNASGAWNIIDK